MSSGLTPVGGQATAGGSGSRRMAFRVPGALFVHAALASAGQGQHQGRTGPCCRSCGRRNEADARFCGGCGTATGA